MKSVNYGGPTRTQTTNFPSGGYRMEVVHDGPHNHHLLKPGEQCECGQLGLGIIRSSGDRPGNHLDVFYEEFTNEPEVGIAAALRDPCSGEPRWLPGALKHENRWYRRLRRRLRR